MRRPPAAIAVADARGSIADQQRPAIRVNIAEPDREGGVWAVDGEAELEHGGAEKPACLLHGRRRVDQHIGASFQSRLIQRPDPHAARGAIADVRAAARRHRIRRIGRIGTGRLCRSRRALIQATIAVKRQ